MDGGGDGEVVGQKFDVLCSEIVAGSMIVPISLEDVEKRRQLAGKKKKDKETKVKAKKQKQD